MKRRTRAFCAALCAAAVLATACSDGGDAQPSASSAAGSDNSADDAGTTSDPRDDAPATTTVTPIDQGVEVQLGGAEFVTITEPTELAAGDVVRTDGSGFAEIDYPDGSITRLDVNTEFEVVSITDDAGTATTRANLTTGRVWNRVQDLGSEGEFSVDTAVGVATVRGTAWVVDCTVGDECVFIVLEGEVEVAPLEGPTVDLVAPFTVTSDGSNTSTPTPVPFDEAFADMWLAENARRDAERGFAPADDIYAAFGPLFASFDGQYDGRGAIGPVEQCATPGVCASEVGTAYLFDYVFSVACDGFMNCVRSVDMTYTARGVTAQARATVVFQGAGYQWSLNLGGNGCSAATPGEVVFTLTPLAAVKTDSIWVITDVRLAAALKVGKNCQPPSPPTTVPTTVPETVPPTVPDETDGCDLNEGWTSECGVCLVGGEPVDCIVCMVDYEPGSCAVCLGEGESIGCEVCVIDGSPVNCEVCGAYSEVPCDICVITDLPVECEVCLVEGTPIGCVVCVVEGSPYGCVAVTPSSSTEGVGERRSWRHPAPARVGPRRPGTTFCTGRLNHPAPRGNVGACRRPPHANAGSRSPSG